MKVLFVFLLIAASSAFQYEFTDGPTAEDFIKGFLDGIGETKSFDDIKKCIKDAEIVIKKIYQAFELIMKFTIDDIIKGLTQLFSAVKELFDVLDACKTGYDVLEKLITAITEADSAVVLQKFMKNIFVYISLVTEAVKCFTAETYECAGKNFGLILKGLFLSDVLESEVMRLSESAAIDFLQGFIEGLGGHFDINQFKNCIKDFKIVFDAIKKAFEAFKTGKFDKIVEGVKNLVKAVKALVDDLKICAKDVEIVKELIKALQNINIGKIAKKLFANLFDVIEIVTETIPCFATKDFKCVGKGFGSIIKIALF